MLVSSSVNSHISNCIDKRPDAIKEPAFCILMSVQVVVTV